MNEKYRFFVFSDIHGEYDALVNGLKEAGYDSCNPRHKLVSLGDNFDRGPGSAQVYKYLVQNHAICVKGNHDVMFEEYLDKGMDGEFVLFNILHNGLGATIKSFANLPQDLTHIDIPTLQRARQFNHWQEVREWIKAMPLYYETKNFIFVHAGFDPRVLNWKDTSEDFMLWDIEHSHKQIGYINKKVVIGHHHAFRVRRNGEAAGQKESAPGSMFFSKLTFFGNTDENRPYLYQNKIALDGCTNLTKKVNIMVFEDEMMPKATKQPGEVEEPTIVSAGYADTTIN